MPRASARTSKWGFLWGKCLRGSYGSVASGSLDDSTNHWCWIRSRIAIMHTIGSVAGLDLSSEYKAEVVWSSAEALLFMVIFGFLAYIPQVGPIGDLGWGAEVEIVRGCI